MVMLIKIDDKWHSSICIYDLLLLFLASKSSQRTFGKNCEIQDGWLEAEWEVAFRTQTSWSFQGLSELEDTIGLIRLSHSGFYILVLNEWLRIGIHHIWGFTVKKWYIFLSDFLLLHFMSWGLDSTKRESGLGLRVSVFAL